MNFSEKLEPMLIKDEKGDQSINLSGDELGPNECVLEAKENKSKAKKMRKRKVNEAEEFEVQDDVNPTDILCFKLFSNVLDTAQSTKIYKFLSHNEAFEILEKQLHDEFKIIGLYGETQTIFNFLEKLFDKPVPKDEISEGIYMYYDVHAQKAAIVFFCIDISIYQIKPIQTSNRANTIVRILSDLCLKIVACIPNDIIENWYYEDKGKKNPFIPKTHVIGGSKLEIIKIYESSLEKIHVKRSKFEYPNCYFPKDSSNWFLTYNINEISTKKKFEYDSEFNKCFQNLTTIESKNIVGTLNFTFNKFLDELQFFKVNTENMNEKLKRSVILYNDSKIKAKLNFGQKIISEIMNFYVYESSYPANTHSFEALLNEFYSELFDINDLNTNDIISKLENIRSSLKPLNNIKKSSSPYNKFRSNFKEFFNTFESSTNKKEWFSGFIQSFEENLVCQDVLKKLWKDKVLLNEKKELEKELLSKKNLDFKKFDKLFKEHLEPFVEQEKIDIFLLVDKLLSEYKNDCLELTDKLKTDCRNILKNVEESVNGIQYNFNISSISFFHESKEDRQLMKCKIEEPNYLFKKYFSNKNIIIKQVISLEKDICFVLLSNQEKKVTHVLRFNPKLTTKDDLEDLKDIDDSDVQISWGSSSNRYIMFCNTKRKSTYGPLYLCKNLQKVQSFKFITK